MVSIDVDNLFTIIPLSETISIILHHFFNQSDTCMNMTCDVLKKLLKLSVKSSFYFFDCNIYTSTLKVWVWVCSLVLPSIIFLCVSMKIFGSPTVQRLSNPFFYKRYVDDVFLLFKEQSESTMFLDYINVKHPNMKLILNVKLMVH